MFERLHDFLRFCPGCGTSWESFHWLCSRCERLVLQKRSLRHRILSPQIDHFYLFDWHPHDNLKPIVHSLKGGGHERAVQEMIACFPKTLWAPQIFYPQGRPHDHAWFIASAVASIMGGEVSPLVPQNFRKQALLEKSARNKRRFYPIENPSGSVLFVDDIVTSGATLQAAFRALGQPAKMTVWSLFYRNRL